MLPLLLPALPSAQSIPAGSGSGKVWMALNEILEMSTVLLFAVEREDFSQI